MSSSTTRKGKSASKSSSQPELLQTEEDLSERRVRSFGISNWMFLENLVQDAPRELAIREAVKNSEEAGASRVDVTFYNGRTQIGDDGKGMTPEEMSKLFDALGASDKPVSQLHNFGVGAKLAALILRTNLLIKSRPKAKANRLTADSVEFERIVLQDGSIQWGPVETAGKMLRRIKLVNREKPYSTIVEFDKPKRCTPKGIRSYLNLRFFRFQSQVRVRESTGFKDCVGLVSVLENVCKKVHTKEYESCTLMWGIRKKGTEAQDYMDEHLNLPCLMYAFQEECFYHSHKSSVLTNWGIHAGQREVVLVIIPKGERVCYTPVRDKVHGWEDADAREEVAQNLPEELQKFVDQRAEAEVEDDEELQSNVQDELQKLRKKLPALAAYIKAQGPGNSRSRKAGRTGSSSTSSGTRNTSDEDRQPRKKKRVKGMPGYDFVQGSFEESVVYDSVNEVLQINLNHATLKSWLRSKKGDANRRLRRDIAVQLLVGWASHFVRYEDVPPPEVLESLVEANLKVITQA